MLPSLPHRFGLFAAPLAGLALMAAAPAAASAHVTISDAQVTEGDPAGAATFVVTRTAGLLAPTITLGYTAEDVAAAAPADYTPTSGTLRFGALLLGGTQTAYIRVPIVNDQLPEETEHFKVRLSGPEVVGTTGLGKIVDDDPQPPSGRLTSVRYVRQQLIARAGNGAAPNAPTLDPVISWDARTARYAAYVSAATDITAGTDGHTNVFLVKRGGRAGKYGTPWQYGFTALASRGLGGAPANGDSWAPALDGWTKGDDAHRPTCLAFVSQASNLVAGDVNNQADVFVRKLSSGTLKRIASPPGLPAQDVSVAGDCRTVSMVAGGTLYTKRTGKRMRKLVSGGVSAPDLTFNGKQISYAKSGRVFARRVGGGARHFAAGSNPTSDGGRPAGKIRHVAYERGGASFWKSIGTNERRIGPGALPAMTAGGTQVMFASGPFVYLWAVSNNFGKKLPQGYCPQGQGNVNHMHTSARGNYIVFSCTGGNAYLTYLGDK
ncbi:MAG: Calx-beta domain-containing protein [Solirubrobacteraceae bacterium]